LSTDERERQLLAEGKDPVKVERIMEGYGLTDRLKAVAARGDPEAEEILESGSMDRMVLEAVLERKEAQPYLRPVPD